MKKRKILSLFFVLCLLLSSYAYAGSEDQIAEIDVHVDIQENGDAIITEYWSVYNDSEGTEWYKPMNNLNHMELLDFNVRFNGEEGTLVDPWNIKASFEEKKNSYGINRSGDRIELCWGKSVRGATTYEISYRYTNFVQKVTMDDKKAEKNIVNAFNAKLINDSMNPAPQKVKILIKSNKNEFNFENSEIYAFGTDTGEIEFKDGNIVFEDNDFSSDKQAIVMLGTSLDLGASYQATSSYEDIKNRALNGSDYDKGNYNISEPTFRGFNIFKFLSFIMQPYFIIFLAIFAKIKSKSKKSIKNIKSIDFEERPYNRESIVKNNSVYLISSVCDANPYMPGLTLREVLAAQIIKWCNDGVLKFNTVKKASGTDYTVSITGKKPVLNEETELYEMIIKNLGDKIGRDITTSEFARVFSKNPRAAAFILNREFVDDYPEYIRMAKDDEKKGNYLTSEGIDLFMDIYGAYNFLKNFTRIEERTIEELALWKDYMVEAVLFKMPDKVMEALKKAAPQIPSVGEASDGYGYSSNYIGSLNAALYVSNSTSSKFYSSYQASIRRSSGGGGGSSFGGGGGSSGGGSGGGSR